MKRLATLLLAAGLIFGASQTAQAVEFKGSGIFEAYFGWSNVYSGKFVTEGTENSDNFRPSQRVRLKLEMIASENLRAVFQIENDILWGSRDGTAGGNGGALGGDGINVEVKHAYLDWVIPQTDVQVRMGLQPFALPAMALGTPILDDDGTGIIISKSFNEYVEATLFWLRAYADNVSSDGHDAVDLFGLIVPLTFEGFNVTPWLAYGITGDQSGGWHTTGSHNDFYKPNSADAGAFSNFPDASVWFAGISAELVAFDPFRFAIDFNYGSFDSDARLYNTATLPVAGGYTIAETDGYYVGAIAEYTFDMVTPGLFAWYASGNDADAATSGGGVLPDLGGGFAATSFGYADYVGSGNGSEEVMGTSPAGTWGIGLQFKDLTFMEDLTHLFRVAYYKGTNEVGSQGVLNGEVVNTYLTDEDSVWEVNFNTQYDIYENLAFILELGYMHADWDEVVWGNNREDSLYRVNATFAYSF